MTTAATIDERMIINNSTEMLMALAEDNAVMAAASLDEAYEVFKKYAKMTKAEFLQLVDFTTPIIASMDNEADNSKRELTDLELNMVTGGGLWSWICNAATKVKNAIKHVWNATPDWVKGAVIGAAAAAVLCTAAISAMAIPALGIYPEICASELTVSYALSGMGGAIAIGTGAGALGGGTIGWAIGGF